MARVYRLCAPAHADLSGIGGRIAANRWNPIGVPMVYTAEHPGLAAVETLATRLFRRPTRDVELCMMAIEVGDLSGAEEAPNLSSFLEQRAWGAAWAKEKRSLLLRYPSVRAPWSVNYAINPLHPEHAELTFDTAQFDFYRELIW